MPSNIAIVDFISVLPWLNISNAELVCYVKNNYPDANIHHIHQLATSSDIKLCDINIFYIDYYTINIAKEVLLDIVSRAYDLNIKFLLYGFGIFYDESFISIDKRFELFPKENISSVCKRLNSLLISNTQKKITPSPDYSLLPIKSIENYPLRTVRGCGNSCPFCEKSLDGFELRSIQEIEQEIVLAKTKYDIKALTIWDPSINFSNERFKELLKILKRAGLPWRSNGMLYKNLNSDFIEEMADSHCYLTSFGIESTDNTVKTGKYFDIKHFTKINRLLKINNIINLSFFVIGLENDNYLKSITSLKQAEDMEIDICLVSSAIAYPKTKLHKHVLNCGGRFIVDYREINLQMKNYIHFDTPYFKEKERNKALLFAQRLTNNNKKNRSLIEDKHCFPFTSSAKSNIKWKL